MSNCPILTTGTRNLRDIPAIGVLTLGPALSRPHSKCTKRSNKANFCTRMSFRSPKGAVFVRLPPVLWQSRTHWSMWGIDPVPRQVGGGCFESAIAIAATPSQKEDPRSWSIKGRCRLQERCRRRCWCALGRRRRRRMNDLRQIRQARCTRCT